MLKRYLAIVIAIALLVSLLGAAVSCAPAAPEVVNIRYSVWAPAPPNPFTAPQAYYWDRVQELTEGRVQMEYYFGGTLMPAKETMIGLKDGIADAACVNPAYHPGQLPLWNVGTILVSGDLYALGMATTELAEHPATKEELAKWNCRYMAPVVSGPYWIQTDVPVNNLDDLKGLKIRAFGEQAKVFANLGIVPVSMTYPEVYEAVAKGTIDGAVSNWVMANIYKIGEVAKYMYMLELGGSAYLMGITDDTWNKISPGDQKIMSDPALIEEHATNYAQTYWVNGNTDGRVSPTCVDVKVTYPSAEDVAKLRAAIAPTWDAWAEARESEGLPGKEIVELWTNAVQKYEAISPWKGYKFE